MLRLDFEWISFLSDRFKVNLFDAFLGNSTGNDGELNSMSFYIGEPRVFRRTHKNEYVVGQKVA